MPTSGAVTANEINVTFQAQSSVENFVSQVRGAIASIAEAATQLGSAMATTAGAKTVSYLGEWNQDATGVANDGTSYGEMLGSTGQQLRAGNQQSEEMAAALPQI